MVRENLLESSEEKSIFVFLALVSIAFLNNDTYSDSIWSGNPFLYNIFPFIMKLVSVYRKERKSIRNMTLGEI